MDEFGLDTLSGKPIWRVVWSEDQFEKRRVDTTDAGITLLFPEVRTVPKYRQWIKEKYVLERLTVVPEINQQELLNERLSYEPIFVFERNNGTYLPPRFDVAKLVVDTIYAAQGKHSIRKYVDPESDSPVEQREARIAKIQAELFGNETNTGDALAYREAIVNPYQKGN